MDQAIYNTLPPKQRAKVDATLQEREELLEKQNAEVSRKITACEISLFRYFLWAFVLFFVLFFVSDYYHYPKLTEAFGYAVLTSLLCIVLCLFVRSDIYANGRDYSK